MTMEVDLETFATALAAGATVIDVREPDEFAAGHVAGARSVPLSQVADRVTELSKNQPVFVICASGGRSLNAAKHLGRAGVDARSVTGGTGGWQRSGRPVVTGSDA
jgi:rhodanese-related sulfurtransferase